jgi:short-subunit dehydrogenase
MALRGEAQSPGAPACTAALFVVAGLSQALRAELKDKGVRGCTVQPGPTVSTSWQGSGVRPARLMPARGRGGGVAFLARYRMTRRTAVEIVLRPSWATS